MSSRRVAAAVLSLTLLGGFLGCTAKPEPVETEAEASSEARVETLKLTPAQAQTAGAQTAPVATEAPVAADAPAAAEAPGDQRAVLRQSPLGHNSQMTEGQVLAAVDHQDFAELERIERQLRTDKTLNENGWWALETYYATFARLLGAYGQFPGKLAGYESLLNKWDKAYPDSLAVPLLQAELYEHKAWQARGNEFAAKVTKRQWEGFGQHMEKAAQALSRKPEQQAQNPAWYATTLTMANSLSLEPEKFAALLARGLSLAPGYGSIVQPIGVVSARKWGGSPQYLEMLAQVALKAGGPMAYSRAYMTALKTADCNCEYEPGELALDWEVFMQGARQDIALKNSARAVNQYAAVACNTAHMQSLTELTPALLEVGKAVNVWQAYARLSTCLPWAEKLQTRAVFVR